jgi:hypothetical protein
MNGVSNGVGHAYTNGIGRGSPNGLPNGHVNGNRSAPGSAGNSSSGGGSSISPPSSTMQEQKTLGSAQFGSAQFGNAHFSNAPVVNSYYGQISSATPNGIGRQARRRTIGPERSAAAVSAPPVLEEEQVATRWNPNGVDAPFENRQSRRNSAVPAFSNSPAFSNTPRAASPDNRRAYSPVSLIRSPLRNGAMSPVSTLRNEGIMRSQSPLSQEVHSTEISRNQSPAQGVGNVARNGNAFLQQQQAAQEHQAALAALQGQTAQPAPGTTLSHKSSAQKMRQRLSLQTQLPPPPPVPEEEEMAEIISMSPAVSAPIVSFRKSRSSLALSALPGNSSQVSLSGMALTSDPNKKYFGQTIDAGDLVATGLENAFSRL